MKGIMVLQGLNKAETAALHGEEKVKIWRRSYDVPPPPLERTDPRYPGNHPAYKNLPAKDIPTTECLKDTVDRFLPSGMKPLHLPSNRANVFLSLHMATASEHW